MESDEQLKLHGSWCSGRKDKPWGCHPCERRYRSLHRLRKHFDKVTISWNSSNYFYMSIDNSVQCYGFIFQECCRGSKQFYHVSMSGPLTYNYILWLLYLSKILGNWQPWHQTDRFQGNEEKRNQQRFARATQQRAPDPRRDKSKVEERLCKSLICCQQAQCHIWHSRSYDNTFVSQIFI